MIYAGAAYACKSEHILGRIAPGFAADFVILDKNVVEDPEALLTTSVMSVCVGGRIVYRHDTTGTGTQRQANVMEGAHVPGRNGDLSATRVKLSRKGDTPVRMGFCTCCGFKVPESLQDTMDGKSYTS